MEGRDLEHLDLKDRFLDSEWTPPFKRNLRLHPWQKLGVTFMHLRHNDALESRTKKGFCIIGDEMGIGKVLSTSAICSHTDYYGFNLSLDLIETTL